MKKCPRCGKEFEDANTLCPADGAVLKRQDELVGQTLAGKYRIEERLSEGGMGCVYRATHVLMEKTLAVKVLHPALAADDNIVARFTREARAASRISHPHAITVTDFGEAENGVVFLVMEYLRGRTLKEVARSEGPMPLKRVAEIVRQVAGALEAAHNEGVVHRDLKSDNIMLDETPGGDWAKVLDFGIAKIKETAENQDPELTAPNLIIGTPQYMSPEQCSGASKIDARSDIYSFGIIIYEMLVGHVPFTADSPTEVMMKQMQEGAPSLLTERDDLPASVDAVVQRALAKSPDDRFQNAGELSEAFASAAAADAPADAAAAAATVAAMASTTDGRGVPETSRIVVPTGENEAPRNTGTVVSEEDEATVVSTRATRTREETREEYAPLPPPPAASFNPWRIAIPAIIVLAAVFGFFYLFQGNDTSGETQPPLASDPNSQPVVSVTPPTGAGESNITPSSSELPTPSPGEVVAGETLPAGGNANVNPGASPTPAAGRQENTNAEGEDEGEEEPEPTPEPTPPARNTNRRAPIPPPPVNANSDDDEAPPPRRPAPTPPPPVSGDVPAPVGASGAPPSRL